MLVWPEIHHRVVSECGKSVTADALDDASDAGAGAAGDWARAAGASAAKSSPSNTARTRGAAADNENRASILVLCGSAPRNHFSLFSRAVPVSICEFYGMAWMALRGPVGTGRELCV